MIALAGLMLALVGQLESATIDVRVAGDRAAITARYRFGPGDTSVVRFVSMRIDDQRVLARDVVLAETAGAYEFTLAPATELTFAYEVVGDLRRVPIFVPSIPTDPVASDVEIRVTGVPSAAAVRDGFPRLREADGGMVARPENLPSFLLLPRERLPANRIADAAVVLIVVGATSYWFWWRRRSPPGRPPP